MASSLSARAERRAAERERDIRGLLGKVDPHGAFNDSIDALQSEASRLFKHRPADGLLAYAELAASLAGLAAQLHGHKPHRPAGCPRMPGPEHLLAVFDAIYKAGGSQS